MFLGLSPKQRTLPLQICHITWHCIFTKKNRLLTPTHLSPKTKFFWEASPNTLLWNPAVLLGPAVHGVLLHPSLLLGGHLRQLAGVVSTSFLAPYSLTIHLSAPKTSSKTIFDWLDEWGAIHWQEDISIAGRRSRSNLSDLLLFGRTSFYWLTKGGLWFTGRKETNIIDIDIICGCTKEELTKCFVISGALGVGAASDIKSIQTPDIGFSQLYFSSFNKFSKYSVQIIILRVFALKEDSVVLVIFVRFTIICGQWPLAILLTTDTIIINNNNHLFPSCRLLPSVRSSKDPFFPLPRDTSSEEIVSFARNRCSCLVFRKQTNTRASPCCNCKWTEVVWTIGGWGFKEQTCPLLF